MPVSSHRSLVLSLLTLLKTHTDEDHRLIQSDILEILRQEYGLSPTRKTLRNNLEELQQAGFPIIYSDGWYYEHEMTFAELDLLVDSIHNVDGLPTSQRAGLLEKLRKLSSKWYDNPIEYSQLRPWNAELMYTLDVLHRAITTDCQVTFNYCNYDVDKKLHPRPDDQGHPKEYLINPYRVASANGRYYLICNVQKYPGITHFRVDRITNIRLSAEKAKPITRVEGLVQGINLTEYVVQHPFMYAGEPVRYKLRLQREAINDVLDWFGMNTLLEEPSPNEIYATVLTDPKSMEVWLSRYHEIAEIIQN